MNQPDFFDIPSPCIGICISNNKGYCKGCLRSREERLYWLNMTDDQKHQVMRLIHIRKIKSINRKHETAHLSAQETQQQFDF